MVSLEGRIYTSTRYLATSIVKAKLVSRVTLLLALVAQAIFLRLPQEEGEEEALQRASLHLPLRTHRTI